MTLQIIPVPIFVFHRWKNWDPEKGADLPCLHSHGVAEVLTSSICCLLWLWQGQNLKYSLEMGQQKADHLSSSPLKAKAGLEGGEALGLIWTPPLKKEWSTFESSKDALLDNDSIYSMLSYHKSKMQPSLTMFPPSQMMRQKFRGERKLFSRSPS